MTVCIAGYSRPDNAIITVCDRMISLGGYTSSDEAIRKIEALRRNWAALVAGDDVTHVVPILRDVRQNLPEDSTMEMVADTVKKAYKRRLKEVAEDEVLTKYGYSTTEAFLKDGKAQLTEMRFDEIVKELSAVKLNCELLCVGFDQDKHPHIFVVSEYGKVSFYGKNGFWAIGSGEHSALSAMFSFPYQVENDHATCTCHVLAAKYAAESAFGVGKSTFPVIIKPGAPIFGISMAAEKAYKAAWSALPKIPYDQVEALHKDMEDYEKRAEERKKS